MRKIVLILLCGVSVANQAMDLRKSFLTRSASDLPSIEEAEESNHPILRSSSEDAVEKINRADSAPIEQLTEENTQCVSIKHTCPNQITFELDNHLLDHARLPQKDAQEVQKKFEVFIAQLQESDLCDNLIQMYAQKLLNKIPDSSEDLTSERLDAKTHALQAKLTKTAIKIKVAQAIDYSHTSSQACAGRFSCNSCCGLRLLEEDLQDQEKHLEKLMTTQTLLIFLKLQTVKQQLQSVTTQIGQMGPKRSGTFS